MYFIAIVLPAAINQKILKYKEYMAAKYGAKVGLKSPGHITLIPPFWLESEKEEGLVHDIGEIRFHPFEVATDNFSTFKAGTIFVAIQPNESLSQLKLVTDAVLKANEDYKIKVGSRPFHPHITIATRDLYKKDFAEAWSWFAGKKFKEAWEALGISILRHNKKNWDVIFTSQFQNI